MCGIMSTQNSDQHLISGIYLNTYRRLGSIELGLVRLAHAQMIMNSDVINVPPHDFKYLTVIFVKDGL
jgi:hypothetical protein